MLCLEMNLTKAPKPLAASSGYCNAVDEPHQGGDSYENATGIPGAMGVGGKSNLSLIMKCLIYIYYY